MVSVRAAFFLLSLLFRTLTLRVPGIGITCGPCARSQASVTCPAEALCFTPTCLISSTTLSTLGKFSFEYRGMMRLRSPSSKSSGLVYAIMSVTKSGTNVGLPDVHICQSAVPSRVANTQRRLCRARARLAWSRSSDLRRPV